MQRIEVNVETGEQNLVDFTEEEIAEIQAVSNLVIRLPDWDNLYGRLLVGDLKPILLSLKAIAKTSPALSIDYTSLTEVLSNIRTEQALKDCLDELIADGYTLNDEHRNLWNNAIAELNFSDLVKV